MSRDISLLHPKLRIIVAKVIDQCKKQGLPILITDCYRTEKEQRDLYAQGRTKAGNIVTNVNYPYSTHCWGVAFDFCRNVKGREYDDSDGFFRKVAAIAKPYGLSWGGDWKSFVDKPHLELTEFSSIATLIKLYRTPYEFKLTWTFSQPKEDGEMERFKTIKDLPSRLNYAKPALLQLMNDGTLAGDGNADLQNRNIDLTEDMIRLLVILDRAKVFERK